MVQFAVLAWAHEHPELTRWSDNVRILETLDQEGLLPAGEAQALTDAYLEYRGIAHQLALQQEPGEVDASLFSVQRERVMQRWQEMFPGLEPAP